MLKLEEYVDVKGKNHFRIWHDSIKDIKTRATIDARLTRVRSENFGEVRSLGSGVFELKIDFGPGFRIYYAMTGKKIVLLLIGGNKKTQPKDIKKSQELWTEYKKRVEA